MKRILSTLLFGHTLILLIVLFAAGIYGITLYINWMQQELMASLALQNARDYNHTLSEFRTIYTSEVASRAVENGLEVTHDYLTQQNAIPLPATLSIMLGSKMAKSEDGGQASLYSAYPFPWRENTGGLTDTFAEEAWTYLIKNPDSTFFKYEQVDDMPMLRYATADVMRPACVNCHNTHQASPKHDWQVGDVRGVLEVSIPVTAAKAVSLCLESFEKLIINRFLV